MWWYTVYIRMATLGALPILPFVTMTVSCDLGVVPSESSWGMGGRTEDEEASGFIGFSVGSSVKLFFCFLFGKHIVCAWLHLWSYFTYTSRLRSRRLWGFRETIGTNSPHIHNFHPIRFLYSKCYQILIGNFFKFHTFKAITAHGGW
jgi:hypothetical protein